MRIQASQVRAFEFAAWQRFEREMVEHSQEFSPVLCKVTGDEQLLIAVRSAMKRAWGYGFTNRGPIRLFVELTLLCGSGFDTDPQYPFAEEALCRPEDQMDRAEALHERHNAYLDEVSGPKAVHERTALRELALLAEKPLPFSVLDLDARLRCELERIFPRKARYVGEAGITTVIEEAKRVAVLHGFHEIRQITLLVALLMAFGHACTSDPLYPWIAGALRDESIPSAAERADALERKALSHLLRTSALDAVGV